MVVLTVSECPLSLRGDLTKWLLEVNPGVFVGNLTARVRDTLWERVRGAVKNGRALMVFNTNNEQHLDFKVHRSEWEPIDFDGIKLMLRPSPSRVKKLHVQRTGYSKASKMRRAKRMQRHS